jgi:hypothetical protein
MITDALEQIFLVFIMFGVSMFILAYTSRDKEDIDPDDM